MDIRRRLNRLERECGLGKGERPMPLVLDGQTFMVTSREMAELLREINGSRILPGMKIDGGPVCTRLTTRVERLEKQHRDEQEYVLVPLPHEPDRTMRLPRRWVEFLAEKGRDCEAPPGSKHHNRTDGQ
jgi:hypothetical protein